MGDTLVLLLSCWLQKSSLKELTGRWVSAFFWFLCSIALKIEEFILHRRGTSKNKEFSVPDRKFQILFPPDFATVMIPKKRWCCVAMALKTRLVISAGLLQRCKRRALCEACRVCFQTCKGELLRSSFLVPITWLLIHMKPNMAWQTAAAATTFSDSWTTSAFIIL